MFLPYSKPILANLYFHLSIFYSKNVNTLYVKFTGLLSLEWNVTCSASTQVMKWINFTITDRDKTRSTQRSKPGPNQILTIGSTLIQEWNRVKTGAVFCKINLLITTQMVFWLKQRRSCNVTFWCSQKPILHNCSLFTGITENRHLDLFFKAICRFHVIMFYLVIG